MTINSRQFFIQGYADRATSSSLSSIRQRTLFMVKPEGMKRFGDVVSSVEKSGLIVANLKSVRLGADAAKEWIASNESMDSVDQTMLTESMCVVMDLRGPKAIDICSSLCKSSSTSLDSKSSSNDSLYTSPNEDAAMADLKFFFGSKAPKSSATYKSCSLCLVKPHIVAQGNVGAVIQAILNKMDISAIQKINFTKQDCGEFLQSYSFLSRFSDHIDEMASGACYAIEVRGGEDIVSRLRAFAGPYDVTVAKELSPDSLRARFGRDSIQNAVHVTDLETDGSMECAFAFGASSS